MECNGRHISVGGHRGATAAVAPVSPRWRLSVHRHGSTRELLLHRVLPPRVPRHPISGYVDRVCIAPFGFFLGPLWDVKISPLPLFLFLCSYSCLFPRYLTLFFHLKCCFPLLHLPHPSDLEALFAIFPHSFAEIVPPNAVINLFIPIPKVPLSLYILGGCPFHGRVERDEIPTGESPPKQSGTLPCPALPSPPLPSPPLHSTPVPSTPLLSPPLHSLPSACLLSIVHLNAHLL